MVNLSNDALEDSENEDIERIKDALEGGRLPYTAPELYKAIWELIERYQQNNSLSIKVKKILGIR